jgi:isoquinoline 1-oxidoreductase beta subunit
VKDRKEWRVIGQPRRAWTCHAKVNGSARFGIDVRLPGMRLRRLAAGADAGRLAGPDRRVGGAGHAGRGAPGAVAGVRGSSAGFAVVAASYWQAAQAAQAVDVEWRPGRGPG